MVVFWDAIIIVMYQCYIIDTDPLGCFVMKNKKFTDIFACFDLVNASKMSFRSYYLLSNFFLGYHC